MDATTKTKTRCEVVDQILPWTDPAGRLNIEVGDLVLDGSDMELIADITVGIDGGVVYSFEGDDRSHHAAGDELVGVRRYIETTEE